MTIDLSNSPPPRKSARSFDAIAVGDSACVERMLTPESLQLSATLIDSANPETSAPLHGKAFAGISAWIGGLIASAIADCLSVNTGLICRNQRQHFLAAIRVGDRLRVEARVIERDHATGHLLLRCTGVNQDGTTVIDGEVEAAAGDNTDDNLLEAGIHVGPDGNMQRLLAHVRSLEPIRVAVVHPCDEASLSAALDARRARLIEPVLVAPRAKLDAVAAQCKLDLTGIEIIDAPHSHAAASLAVDLAAKGKVEMLMKGSLHTDELMAAVVAPANQLRTKRRISHCFVLQTPSYPRPFIVTDAAINLAPDLAQKADIVRNAIDLAHVIGVPEPKVAILAAVETVNPSMPATLDAAALCKMADRGQITGGHLDGPLAFDNAISLAAAQTKGIVSPVAGQADILLVPDLESGNMLAKQLIYLGQAASAGIVLGAKVPIVLTSRADSRQARIASCALALMLAHRYRQTPP